MFRPFGPFANVESLESRTLFSSYYVDYITGSDANNGRSPRTPWQTLNAVNAHTFKRGDKVLLTGTFSGQSLVLAANATGVTVNSYTYNPITKATRVGVANAADLTNLTGDGVDILTSNVTVENLTLTADPSAMSTGNYNYGIHLSNTGSVVLSHETINDVTASGFSYSGLCMQGWNTSATDSAGFSDVLIENSAFFGNAVSGIFVGAGNSTGNNFQPEFPATLYLNANLTIRNCKAYDNAGFNAALNGVADGDQYNRGNFTAGGIFISSVNNALVENCTVFNNNFNSSGSVGTWAFDATRVTFQNDESDDNKTANGTDGEGFDFDHGVTNSVMQRDYSHGNAGAGFFITTYGGTSNDNNDTIRYCVGDDDGQSESSSEITVQSATVPVLNASIYNNTLLAGGDGGIQTGAIAIAGANTTAKVLNNILDTTGGTGVTTDPGSTASVQFHGNDYWAASTANLNINWGGTAYTTLAAWAAASGEEMNKGMLVGHEQDPQLVNATASDLPATSLDELMLSPHSPLLKEAFNLTATRKNPFGLSATLLRGNGNVNVFGRRINPRAIGAG